MAVGFAAFSQQLTINSTSEVTSSWCVGFDTSKTTDYVGTPGGGSDTESIAIDSEQEKQIVWNNGKVGLIQLTDYLKASTSSDCISLNAGYSNGLNCGTNNWIKPVDNTMWTLNPYVGTGYGSEYV